MDDRKIKILYFIIQDFICTGAPVGSRTLSKKYNLGVSSATIRNEMCDLEELGLLEQVHTSSGRKPSNKGYRLYVDKLMKPAEISKEEEKSIKSDLDVMDLFGIENILKNKLGILSKLTNLTCILKLPPVIKNSIKSIQFIRISDSDLLIVVITNEGSILNNVIKVSCFIAQDDISIINRIINENLVYRIVEDIDLELLINLKGILKLDSYIFEKIISILYDILRVNRTGDWYVEGIDNILSYHEFSDIDKAKSFFYLINDRSRFETLLTCDSNKGIEVKIGKENRVREAEDYSIILGDCKKDGKVLGTIGVVGPTRMDYSKTISVLKLLLDIINSSI